MNRILADLPDEKVRVESPDMFGGYDDHQRQIHLDRLHVNIQS